MICLGLFDVVFPTDCAAPNIAGDCVLFGNGKVDCVPRATDCSSTDPDTCDGNSLVTCGTDQKWAHIDCTTLGFRSCGDVGGRKGCVM
jgi:hypothetical protein